MPGQLTDDVEKILNLPDNELRQLDHAQLYMLRAKAPPESQDKLASAEHRAFAREATAENPLLALPIALATIAYQPYKMLVPGSRSHASMDQAAQGLIGVGEGIVNALKKI
jgi:hypothetical protein